MAYTPDEVALAIITEGQTARTDGTPETLHPVIAPRGIQIALSTAIVESNERDLANPNVPESENYPNDGDGYDHDSVGPFQQQFMWWGTVAEEMDPRLSAAMFYHHLAGMNYNDPGTSPGTFAQDVQQSAFPTRYDQAFDAAVAQYERLTVQPPSPAPAPEDPPVANYTQAPYDLIDMSQNNDNCEDRLGENIRLIILHTEEGDMTGSAFEEWMANNGVSYGYIVNPDGSVICMETDDVGSWSVLDPANEISINVCFAGSTVNWSRQEWLDNMGLGIQSAAFLAVQKCQKFGLSTQVLVGDDYPKIVDGTGITDHYAITVTGFSPGSTHTDVSGGMEGGSPPYPKFPWDVLENWVAQYSGTQPAPAPAPVPDSAQTYTVAAGDSIYRIARQFGVTEDALLAANPSSITNRDLIFVGQVLVIPEGT